MKTRNGHVTNSSSTSFVVVGKTVKFEDILNDAYFKDRKYIAFGKQLCEARDVFYINEEHLTLIQAALPHQFNEGYTFEFIEALSKSAYESGELVVENDLEDTFSIFFGRCDQNDSASVSGFAENYPEIFEDENENQNQSRY